MKKAQPKTTYTTVHCSFQENGKTFTYLAARGIKKGDYVVVDVSHGNLCDTWHPFRVIRVEKVDVEPVIERELKWIIQRVDMKAYQKQRRQLIDAIANFMTGAKK